MASSKYTLEPVLREYRQKNIDMPNQNIVARVERIVAGGEALIRSTVGIVFAPAGSCAPGDTVRFSIEQTRKNLRATNIEVLDPSPGRREAACEYYGSCGGCDLMHLTEGEQLAVKKEILLESLQRIGKIPDEAIPAIGLWQGKSWQYRTRLQVQVDGGTRGFARRQSREVVPIARCAVANPELNSLFENHQDNPQTRAVVQGLVDPASGTVGAVILRDNQPGSRKAEELPPYPSEVSMRVAGLEARVPVAGFFQSNTEGLAELIRRLRMAAGEDFGGKKARILELYCGIGILGAALAEWTENILGVDLDPQPAAYSANGRKITRSVADFARRAPAGPPPELVIADPSRKGLDREVFAFLERAKLPRLYLVFCDPVSAGRDLSTLVRIGYRIQEISILDFYPQTSHFETFVRLEAV